MVWTSLSISGQRARYISTELFDRPAHGRDQGNHIVALSSCGVPCFRELDRHIGRIVNHPGGAEHHLSTGVGTKCDNAYPNSVVKVRRYTRMVKKLMRPFGSSISANHPVFLESVSSYSLSALHWAVRPRAHSLFPVLSQKWFLMSKMRKYSVLPKQ